MLSALYSWLSDNAVLASWLAALISTLAFLVHWWQRRRQQPKVRVHNFTNWFDTNEPRRMMQVVLTFEFENVGGSVTSLEPEIECRCLNGHTLEWDTYRFHVTDQDRQLQPHASRTLTAKALLSTTYVFSWYYCYRLNPTKGRGTVYRHTNASDKKSLGLIRYKLGIARFRRAIRREQKAKIRQASDAALKKAPH